MRSGVARPVAAVAGAAALVALAVGTVALTTSPATRAAALPTATQASTPTPTPVGTPTPTPTIPAGQYPRELIDTQDALLAVVDPIVDVADPSESQHRARLSPAAEAGYAGVSIDAQTSSIHLAWKGPLPDAVQRILHRAPASITVEVTSATYSLAELHRGQAQVMALSDRLEQRIGVRITTVYAGTLGDGLTVGYALAGTKKDPGPAAVLATMRTLTSAPLIAATMTGDDVSDSLRG